ncbi:MAG TPA: CsiV family protein [Wenzhouxiangella sp.]|nr:CsiV family protein [Wenzhouxiangella sp.]
MKLSLSILLAALTLTVQAAEALAQENANQGPFYRVEAIVFTHAGGSSDAWLAPGPAGHVDALDPAWKAFARQQELARAAGEERSSESELEAALNVVDALASLESGEESLIEALLYPEPWLALDELSAPMAQARSRLEQSGAFRVHAWLAWYQPLEQSTRPRAVRIHDNHPIAAQWITLAPTGRLLRDGRPVQAGKDLAPDFHYRLDGTIRLRQRQFMHADVIFDWRARQQTGPSAWPDRSNASELVVHRLEESRAIRPERYEYFDSEWLGVIVRVTPFQLEAVDTGAEQTMGVP